jgi:hypothetical protein
MPPVDGGDKRREERIRVALPVDLGNADGLTADVSASGMYFETSATFNPGEQIRFSVEFDAAGGKMVLRCLGQIVRTVMRDGRQGVAVTILDSTMETRAAMSRELRIAPG